ncbi:D-alanine--D-alanine ligase [Eggerthellaceae bacterium zg-1084]|uniref:D-alanine--D-alanine ligase family protein n=1 Tax=Berryella wangjianweii TaxID=2734634 RepID=UPI00155732AA|nr:D-alanine--D-alanine ligase [Berryella wangjianweii]NPD30929.1 D-alanine--D-alanine ligase [Berryella wangjianweii]NPD31794.1 D-alanine--D-alanine ligase [Eggerthellaceae bacterium zg-997]
MTTSERLRVALLYGGTSGEREISIASAEGAYEALCEGGHLVERIDTADKSQLGRLFKEQFDVAFICLHGRMGEDGSIQGLLEHVGIPYTGSGVLGSALALDKARAKVHYRAAGLRTPRGLTVHQDDRLPVDWIIEAVGLPCVVKPSTEGSALGVFVVTTPDELSASIEQASALDSAVLVEEYIAGVELTVAVLGNRELEALPVIQIVPAHEFYDFESKYAEGGSRHICPAEISEEATAEAQRLAMEAHVALGCRGMSRSDIIMNARGELYLLETNTIPGMTKTSLLPDAARVAGMSFPQLCERLVNLALER